MAIKEKKLSGALQENILTLLCFDTDACPIIIAAVDSSLFESVVYRTIADRAIAYFRKYKKAPGDHLPDLVEDFLNSPKRSDIRLYTDAVNDLHAASDGINRKYTIDSLQEFVKQQSLRRSVTLAAEALQQGNSEAAEKEMIAGLKTRIAVFDRGMSISQAISDKSLYEPQLDLIRTGIKPLDNDGICPAPGELLLIMALANRGKSWALQSMGKYAALQRKNVLHVTLEMNELKTCRRYVQSFFSMTRKPETFQVPLISTDDKGRYTGLKFKKLRRRPSLLDESARRKLQRREKRFGKKFDRIIVKGFPTGHLSTDGLIAYMEMLEQEDGFVPDLLIVDYADLMKVDTNNLRIDTGRLYRDLRGIAGERNCACVSASQSNRQGEDQRILTMKNFAEDYSKSGTADNVITYNQTTKEEALGLARLFVVKARDERKGQTILITQAYAAGQFCLDAVRMGSTREYWKDVDTEVDV